LPAHNVAVLTGKEFFPHLISAPFHHGLVIVFTAAAIMSVTGAIVSLLRGKQFYYDEAVTGVPAAPVPAATSIIQNGSSITPAKNGDSAPVAGAAARRHGRPDQPRRRRRPDQHSGSRRAAG
jgi:hypothetical protein